MTVNAATSISTWPLHCDSWERARRGAGRGRGALPRRPLAGFVRRASRAVRGRGCGTSASGCGSWPCEAWPGCSPAAEGRPARGRDPDRAPAARVRPAAGAGAPDAHAAVRAAGAAGRGAPPVPDCVACCGASLAWSRRRRPGSSTRRSSGRATCRPVRAGARARRERGRPPGGRKPPGDPPAETPLIGRDAETGHSSAPRSTGAVGRGGMVAIVGEAGIGKTRLVEELIGQRSGDDARVLPAALRERPDPSVRPLGGCAPHRRGGPWPRRARRARARLARRAARLFPEVAARRMRRAAQVDARRLFEGITQLIRSWRHATAAPRAGGPPLGRRADGAPPGVPGTPHAVDRVLIAMTAREEELRTPRCCAARSRISGGRASRWRSASVRSRVATPPLSSGASRRPGAAARAEQLEEHAWSRSAGNPFVVVETVRALHERAA